jgi:hypothetical protein
VLFVLPDPEQPGLTPAERLGLTIRNAATASGRCACGAFARVAWAGHVVIEHERGCPAASPALDQLADRLGSRGRYTFVVGELRRVA